MTRGPHPRPRMHGLAGPAGLVLALAVASASYASTPTRPATSPTQRTAARDTEAGPSLAMQLSLPELMCSLALPAGWRRDAATEGEPTQFRAPDGATTYTVGVLRAPAPAEGAGRCEHARSMADIRHRHAYATFIVATESHVWTSFPESPTLSRAELTRLGDTLFPTFRAQP